MSIRQTVAENRVLDLLERRLVGDYPGVTVEKLDICDDPAPYQFPITLDVDGGEVRARLVVTVEVEDA